MILIGIVIIAIVIVIVILIVIVIIWMQSNFEKLTREELVIIEADNILQPAAIQKVMMMMTTKLYDDTIIWM